jgi:hypothetical protein
MRKLFPRLAASPLLLLLAIFAQSSILRADPPMPPGAAPGEDNSAAEIMKRQQAVQQAMGVINNTNPFSDDYGKNAATVPPPGSQTLQFNSENRVMEEQMAKAQAMLSNPFIQGYLKLFSNPEIMKGFQEIMASPNRPLLIYAEIGGLLAVFVFRAWRKSKTQHWFGRFWISLYTSLLWIFVGGALLPSLIIGKVYVDTLSRVVHYFTR